MAQARTVRECPACGGAHSVRALVVPRDGREFEYQRCAACSTLFLADLPSDDFLRQLYQDHEHSCPPNGQLSNGSAPARIPPKLSVWLRPHSWPPFQGRGRWLLDIGCSSGRHLHEFALRGWNVAGIDVDAKAIARARKLVPDGAFHVGTVAEAKFPAGQFDVIRIDNTLEHVADPRALIARAREWVSPEGVFVAYVPNGGSATISVLGRHSINAWVPFHLQLLSRDGLVKLLKSGGFRSASCWGYTPRGVVASSLLQWRRGEVRDFRAPAVSPMLKLLELLLMPVLAVTRRQEELIGVARLHE